MGRLEVDAEHRCPVAGNAVFEKEIVSRAEFTQQLLKSTLWNALSAEGRNEIVTRSFATQPADPNLQAAAGTDLTAPLEDLLEKETNLRAAVLISDGDWNLGQPPVSAAQKFLLRKIPLFTIPAGSEKRLPDLDLLAVNAPTYGIVGENIQIPFTIRSSLDREVRTTVRLRDDTGRERTKTLTLPANKTTYDTILWKLEKEGSSTLELSFPPAQGELVPLNNSRKFTIAGKPEKIRVLVVESLPRWEYRYLRNALSRDPGVELSCLLFHPQLGMGGGPDYIDKFPEKIENLAKSTMSSSSATSASTPSNSPRNNAPASADWSKTRPPVWSSCRAPKAISSPCSTAILPT